MRRRVFLTGATGRLGPALLRALLAAGFAVRALRRRTPIAAAMRAFVEVVDGDLAAEWPVAEALQDVDAVVHFAALQQGPIETMRAVNVDATASLAHAAAAGGVRRFVLASSASVYAPGVMVDADESRATAPVDAYGTSKLLAEAASRAAFPRELVALRICTVYSGAPDCALMCGALQLARSDALPSGDARIELVHADDVAACVVAALGAEHADGVFNVAGPTRPRFDELMRELAAQQGIAARFVDDPAAVPPHMLAMARVERTLATGRARREFGWSPRHAWPAAVVDAARVALGVA